MDIVREEKQRKEFCDILLSLAESQELLQDASNRLLMYRRLEALYYSMYSEAKFRHFYSDIFLVLTQLQGDPTLGDINILGQNLALIRAEYQPQNIDEKGNLIDIRDSIRKLYDHVNLDIARISYSDARDRQVSGEKAISELQTEVNHAKEEISLVKNEQKTVEEKINNQQKEYIAILGIFSAVVLTFIGGIAFSTSVLENIAQASVYRTLIITLIIGLVLINVFFCMFYYVNSLINKKKDIKWCWVSNIILILLMIVVIIAWAYGVVEKRNERVNIATKSSYSEEHVEEGKIRLGILDKPKSTKQSFYL